MKHFTDTGDLVPQSIDGFVAANPQLVHLKNDVIAFRDSMNNPNKVTLISGGGSGHEPTHAGFLGPGLLDAVAVGRVFASPSAHQVQQAQKAVCSDRGTIFIVKNYTGDVLNFGLAVERAKAAGHDVRMVIVGDDVSNSRDQGKIVGRRGLAGVILVHKVAGAAAAAGKSIDEVAALAEKVAENLATIAASMDHCIVPGRPFDTDLSKDEYEIGMGIHNEAGVFRQSPLPSVSELVDKLLPYILDMTDEDRAFVKFKKGDEVVLLVNNLGGLSTFMTSYVTAIALECLETQHNLKVSRVISGTFTTAFNGPGVSLTLLNLSNTGTNILDYLDVEAHTAGWPGAVTREQWTAPKKSAVELEAETEDLTFGEDCQTKLPAGFSSSLERGLHAIIAAEPKLTIYDTVAGDGDCGETLKAGATALLKLLKSGKLPSNAVQAIITISSVVGEAMGGTSGGLYSIFIAAFAQQLHEENPPVLDVAATARAARGALQSFLKYTRAREGDRTLVDALQPFIDTLLETSDYSAALKAAEEGMRSTITMQAHAGRAAYVGQDKLMKGNVPDPGAYGVVQLLKGWCGE